MDDKQIVDLYWNRSEDAITATDQKYGKYCYRIAYNILTNNEDAEESVSDTYMAAWKAIPPRRPSILSTFLGKITRHISLHWKNWKIALLICKMLKLFMSRKKSSRHITTF